VALERRLGGPFFWITAIGGWAVVGYGVRGLLQHRVDTRPGNLAKFVVGGALAHDLLFAPAILIVGVLVARVVPGRVRAVVQGALIVSGCLALLAYPLVRDYAAVLHNPSSLPHNYGANLAAVLGVVWGGVTIVVVVVMARRRRGT
jgi:hypothetical protein